MSVRPIGLNGRRADEFREQFGQRNHALMYGVTCHHRPADGGMSRFKSSHTGTADGRFSIT